MVLAIFTVVEWIVTLSPERHNPRRLLDHSEVCTLFEITIDGRVEPLQRLHSKSLNMTAGFEYVFVLMTCSYKNNTSRLLRFGADRGSQSHHIASHHITFIDQIGSERVCSSIREMPLPGTSHSRICSFRMMEWVTRSHKIHPPRLSRVELVFTRTSISSFCPRNILLLTNYMCLLPHPQTRVDYAK